MATTSAIKPAPLWRGRAAILLGVVLLGIGLRHAVTLLSPLLGEVRDALGIGTAGATLIGMLPTLRFGAAGFIASVLSRKFGAEKVALLAMLLAAAGTLARLYSGGAVPFMALTMLALLGMGMGNVVAGLAGGAFPLAIAGGVMMARPGRWLEDTTRVDS